MSQEEVMSIMGGLFLLAFILARVAIWATEKFWGKPSLPKQEFTPSKWEKLK